MMARAQHHIPYRLEVARALAVRMTPETKLPQVLRDYWHQVPCPRCGHYDNCGCRNIKSDIRTILEFYKGEEEPACQPKPIEFYLL